MRKTELFGITLVAIALISINVYKGQNDKPFSEANRSDLSFSQDLEPEVRDEAKTVVVEVTTSEAWADEAYCKNRN